MKSNVLVFFQLLFIFLFLLTGPLFAKNVFLLIIELAAVALGAWAVRVMQTRSKFSAFPEPAKKAQLLETGPYRYIRNPMYSAILLAMVPLLLDDFTPLRLALCILEAIVLIWKISIEEKLLPEKFKDYAAYTSRTRRLIPFLF